MLEKLKQIMGDDEQKSVFTQLRSIRFDTDLEQPTVPYQKYISVSYNVEDMKGNPGSSGQFFVTNFKIFWQLKNDPSTNVVFGWDSVVLMEMKTTPVSWGNGFKHVLLVKAQSQSQTKYEFRFSGANRQEHSCFEKCVDLYKKISETKQYRCTNLAVKYENELVPLSEEDVKNEYDGCMFYEDNKKFKCKIFVTNCRIIVIKENEKKMNWGITWLMVRSVEPYDDDDIRGIRLNCRGLLSSKLLVLSCSKGVDMKKLQFELRSFSEVYNKTPILGFSTQIERQVKVAKPIEAPKMQISQVESTKLNLARRKKAYTSTQADSSAPYELNVELGLMMEKLPEGVSRSDLWQIIK